MKTNLGDRALALVGGLFFGISLLSLRGSSLFAAPASPADLFQTEKVWTVHLKFTPEQWEAMEPAGAEGGMPGPGPMRFGGPGGFGPAVILAPGFLKGDQDGDGKLSESEFTALGERWFRDWDKDQHGELNFDQLRQGLGKILVLPQFGPRGGGAPNGPPGPPLEGSEGHRNGLASAAGIDFKYVRADLDFGDLHLADVAVRYKGNGTFMESRNSLKRSLKIELNKYVKGQKLAGETKLNLHNNVTDASWMNEVMSHRLFRDAGVPAPRTAYAKVFVTVSGKYDHQYFGLYSLVEDVDSHFAKDHFKTKEGAIFKPVTRELFGYLGEDWSKYNQMYDPKTELSDSQKRRVIDFSKLVTSATDAEFSAKISDYLDLEEFARFMSVTVGLSTMDSILMMGQNFYIYLHPQTHKFQFIPWDLDHSFGQFPMGGSQEDREELSILKPWRGTNRFLERVFNTEAFKKIYLATMKEFAKTLFIPQRFTSQVDEIARSIRPAVQEESELKLARFDRVVSGESVEHLGFGGGPGRPMRDGPIRAGGPGFGRRGFGQSVKPIKAFVVARARSIEDQLAGKSQGATLEDGGFGPPGRRMMGPGPRDDFGPANFIGHIWMDAFDTDKNGSLTHAEFVAGFAKWFGSWDQEKKGALAEEQLRAGINRDLSPFRGGPPDAEHGFGPPEENPPEN